VAVPLLVGVAVAGTTSLRAAFGRALLIASVILLLQVPWLVHVLRAGTSATPTPMLESVLAVARDPLGAPQPIASAAATVRAIAYNTGLGVPPSVAAVLIAFGAIALTVTVRDTLLRMIAAGPLVCAVALFAVWQGSLNENYWFLALSLPAALCVFGWLSSAPIRVTQVTLLCCLAALAYLQPAQAHLASTSLRTPIYGALVAGSRAALASAEPISEIRTQFDMPPGVAPSYIYHLLGGRLQQNGRTVVIDPAGRLAFDDGR
jgi:hypothetical protein